MPVPCFVAIFLARLVGPLLTHSTSRSFETNTPGIEARYFVACLVFRIDSRSRLFELLRLAPSFAPRNTLGPEILGLPHSYGDSYFFISSLVGRLNRFPAIFSEWDITGVF